MKYLSVILLLAVFLACPKNTGAQSTSPESSPASVSPDIIPSDLTLLIGKSSYDISQSDISGWTREKTKLRFSSSYRTEIENSDFCLYEKSLLCRLSFPYKNQGHIQKIYIRNIQEEAIKDFIKDLARKFNKDPENAKLKMEDGRVSAFSLGSSGIRLEEEESVKEIKKYLAGTHYPKTISLPFREIQPEISTNSIDNLGITSLIGEGRSNFRGSPKNRIFNIKVATKRFDGILIKPGEEFSFVKNLGEVDGDHGYLPELVIKKDKTEPEFGGGICQVSTTAFRAAIYSGLEITARRNHAYPVAYYNPQGMDATIYIPRPDLRFTNDTPGYILIQTRIEGTELIFSFYGTSDGRKANVIGPKILEHNPDGSMKTTFTQQVFDKNEKLTREDVFNSVYDSPNKYPHPNATENVLTKKPKGWSDKEWGNYKKAQNS